MGNYPENNNKDELQTHNLDQTTPTPEVEEQAPAPVKKVVPIRIIKKEDLEREQQEKAAREAEEQEAAQVEEARQEVARAAIEEQQEDTVKAAELPEKTETPNEKKPKRGLFGLFKAKEKNEAAAVAEEPLPVAPVAEPQVFEPEEAEMDAPPQQDEAAKPLVLEAPSTPIVERFAAPEEPGEGNADPLAGVQSADASAAPVPVAAAKKPAGKLTDHPAWNSWLRPLVVLTAICLITSLLLSLTNMFTQPIIDRNIKEMATAARMQLLPQASGFVDETPNPLPSGITAVYRAENDVGYVIEAYAKGYGGNVPAMVAFNAEGNIAGVKFSENSETPGLGKNVEKPGFATQFTGLSSDQQIDPHSVDGIAAATISTNAAVMAVNAAIEYYFTEIQGGMLHYEISDNDLAKLLDTDTWEQLEVSAPGVAGAYLGDNGVYVIIGQAGGVGSTVTAAVALSEDGRIFGLLLDVSGETKENQELILNDSTFMNSFVNKTSVDGIDGVAGATGTSDAVKEAVGYAINALPLAKEAAA